MFTVGLLQNGRDHTEPQCRMLGVYCPSLATSTFTTLQELLCREAKVSDF